MSSAVRNASRVVWVKGADSASRGANAAPWTTKSRRPIDSRICREERVDLLVGGDVARHDQRLAPERRGELADVLFEALTLEGEREVGARFGRPSGDRPRERTLVGHTENEALLAG